MLSYLWEITVYGFVAGFLVPAVTHPFITVPSLIALTGLAIWKA